MPDFKPWQWATLITLLVALNIVVIGGLITVIVTYDLWANPGYLAAEPTVPAWATPTATQRPTFTSTPTPQTWPTATPTRTPTHTPPPTPTWTPLPTRTPWPTHTPTSYRPPTGTPTSTPTRTRVPTRTPLPTLTPTPQVTFTSTPQPTFTWTPTSTHTPFPTSTPLPTSTQTRQVQSSPTLTSSPAIAASLATATPSATLRPSPSPTHTPSPTMTYTPAPSPSSTRTPTPSPSPTATPSPSPSPTATSIPSPTPTATGTPLPVTDAHSIKATSLTGNSVSLSWEPIPDAAAYRVYSDMGTGYGVYLLKAETRQHELTDTSLRAGVRYQYRVGSVTSAGEMAIAWIDAVTPGQADLQAKADQSAPWHEPPVPVLSRPPVLAPPAQASPPAPAAGPGPAPTVGSGDGAPHMQAGQTDPRTQGRVPITNAEEASALAAPKPAPSPVRVTPAPTPLPPDTIILGLLSASDYADDVEDTLTIVGEVRNDSHLDVAQAVVTATFYGTDGQVIGEVSGSTILHTLAPGIRSPFIITMPRPAGLANYSMRATGRPVSLTTTRPELNVVNTRRFEDTTGFYHVAGVIENPSDRRVEQARVVVTLYDRAGRVVNVGFAYPQPSSLSPSDRADFDVTFNYYPKVFSHLAIAMGD
jgi:hypothetical protein